MHTTDTRIARERAFHNQRFGGETRQGLWKYYTVLDRMELDYKVAITSAARDKTVLDYGCAFGHWTHKIARLADEIHGIDISDVAIERARAERASRAHFHVMDAHETSFPDNTFDVVFGSSIIHHLDTRRCFTEVRRILKPGGVAIFKEPLGHNPVFNAYRSATPDVRTSDEHPLRKQDHRIAAEIFSGNHWRFYALTSLASVPLRNTPLGKPVRRALQTVDSLLLSLPAVRWLSWFSIMQLRK
jgi:SAM-dependent methyltransferase